MANMAFDWLKNCKSMKIFFRSTEWNEIKCLKSPCFHQEESSTFLIFLTTDTTKPVCNFSLKKMNRTHTSFIYVSVLIKKNMERFFFQLSKRYDWETYCQTIPFYVTLILKLTVVLVPFITEKGWRS
jgi:hypothetical protein